MSSGDNQGNERDMRQRIVSLMQSIGQESSKPLPADELQKLKTAANRLDQMLKASGDADQQLLTNAVGRLDRLLADIRTGKDVTSNLKRRQERQKEDGNPG
jgi:hypothetical protein